MSLSEYGRGEYGPSDLGASLEPKADGDPGAYGEPGAYAEPGIEGKASAGPDDAGASPMNTLEQVSQLVRTCIDCPLGRLSGRRKQQGLQFHL